MAGMGDRNDKVVANEFSPASCYLLLISCHDCTTLVFCCLMEEMLFFQVRKPYLCLAKYKEYLRWCKPPRKY